MRSLKRFGFYTGGTLLVILMAALGWFLWGVFEGEKPEVAVDPLPQFITREQTFQMKVRDARRGLRHLKVTLIQEGREIPVLDQNFPFEGLFNAAGVHELVTELSIQAAKLKLAQGAVDLQVEAWDYSRRGGGDGNVTRLSHRLVVDTLPPSIRAVSRMHYIREGGTGCVAYQTSADTRTSGVYVGDLFFPGYPAAQPCVEGGQVCYFALPCTLEQRPEIYLWADDQAGNVGRASFYYKILDTRFRQDKMSVSQDFLNLILPRFPDVDLPEGASDLERFLKINRDLRQANAETYCGLKDQTEPHQIWQGTWLRMANAAPMAAFGDRRAYYFGGQCVDNQVHMGVDLASLANAEVPASNDGRVIYAAALGIYGQTVVLDHGQGLASIYSHLSRIDVPVGTEVRKGQTVGLTGQTGLAGGDHLHFGVMVSGVFVNPVEWWDSHWIQDNVERKLALLKP